MAFAESETLVTLILEGSEASELKHMMASIDWVSDFRGSTATAVFEALHEAGVEEA